MSYTCANCTVVACVEKEKKGMPKNCPMRNEAYMGSILDQYSDPAIHDFYYATKTTDVPKAESHFMARLVRNIYLMKHLGYKKLGLAFCIHLKKEAELYAEILEKHGFEVESVCCCNGGMNLADLGVKLPEGCEFEAACNPIGQAKLLNKAGVDFNLLMGLCSGCDSLFFANAEASSTTLISKDPATGHCPLVPIYLYDSYYKPYIDNVELSKKD